MACFGVKKRSGGLVSKFAFFSPGALLSTSRSKHFFLGIDEIYHYLLNNKKDKLQVYVL